jgi:hypothetical protein
MGTLDMLSVCKTNGARRVKALLLYVALFISAALSNSLAVNLTLGWDPSPDAQVTGYKVYYGIAGTTKQKFSVGNTTIASLSNLLAGQTYEFYVTAYDATGAESEPSNQITYLIPGSTTLYKLSISGFKDGYVQVSPRGFGTAGNLYEAGTYVTLAATAKAGAIFTYWEVNGVRYNSSVVTVPINAATVASPFFRKANGQSSSTSESALSMAVEQLNSQTVLSIGGEAGAWILESSADMVNWQQVAGGITSERLPISTSTGNGFYRVRTLSPSEL